MQPISNEISIKFLHFSNSISTKLLEFLHRIPTEIHIMSEFIHTLFGSYSYIHFLNSSYDIPIHLIFL